MNLFVLFLFILGICVGSFLNVLIDRLAQDESVIKGRSRCDRCKKTLGVPDLIPILSFIFLKGRCRYCGTKISRQYPLVEALTGAVWLAVYSFLLNQKGLAGISVELAYYLTSASCLIVILITDLKYRIIPDEMVAVLAISAFIYLYFSFGLSITFLVSVLSGLTLFSIFLALVIVTKGKGMGLGDVKYAFYMGLALGFPNIIPAFYLSFLTGALISLILVITERKKMKSKIAFGPYLVLSTFISLFYGDQLWLIFRSLLGG